MSTPAIRVLLAEDQAIVRAGFRALLDSEPDIAVAGEAATGTDAVQLAKELRPDLVVMDKVLRVSPERAEAVAREWATARHGKMGLEIEEIFVDQRSPFAGKSIEESKIRQELGVIVLAIKHAGQDLHFNPAPDDRIEPGDYLVAMGQPAGLRKLEATSQMHP